MKAVSHTRNDVDDVVLDTDAGTEFVAEESEIAEETLRDKLKSLREQLSIVTKERDENLAGWQRAKADLINYRRIASEDRERDIIRAKGTIARSVIPALDSFEHAVLAESWKTMPTEWREGVERIKNQLTKALADEGMTLFGTVGDAFDPTLHECMSVVRTDDSTKDHTIAQVLQRGYTLGNEIIRAAKVVVAQTHDE